MARQIRSLSELRNGQRVVSLLPTVLGTVEKNEIISTWSPIHGHKKSTEFLLVANKTKRRLGPMYVKDGILVSDGPCKNRDCSLGLVRNNKTGMHYQCKTCFGSWLS